MDTGGRLARRSGCCVSLGNIQFAHPGRFAVAATRAALAAFDGLGGLER
jgi:hypothetical protein